MCDEYTLECEGRDCWECELNEDDYNEPLKETKQNKMSKMEIKNLTIDGVTCFNNSESEGVILSWSANIGFGELTVYQRSTDVKWYVDTECMGKDFAQMVLNKWIDDMEVK